MSHHSQNDGGVMESNKLRETSPGQRGNVVDIVASRSYSKRPGKPISELSRGLNGATGGPSYRGMRKSRRSKERPKMLIGAGQLYAVYVISVELLKYLATRNDVMPSRNRISRTARLFDSFDSLDSTGI